MDNLLEDPRVQAAVAAGSAIASILAPAAGPTIALADQLLKAGMTFWADFAAKRSAGALTTDDLDKASAMVGAKLDDLRAEVERREALGI